MFSGSGLQERHDNLLYHFPRWGKDFIIKLYEHSQSLEQEFVVVQEK